MLFRSQPVGAKTATIYRRIGSTTYKVRVHFSETAKETMNDKILHSIRRGARFRSRQNSS